MSWTSKAIIEDVAAKQKLFRKQWVEALRSSKYNQTKRRLHDANGYCCLGVLCELHHGVDRWRQVTDTSFFEIAPGVTALPTAGVIVAAGLKSADGSFAYTDELAKKFPKIVTWSKFSLAAMNDSGFFTFDDIADLIEFEPEGMFYRTGDNADCFTKDD